ncbi:MAG: hypothetical protein GX100_03440 [candidate division WS1 bacterium]|nr:hypothetical protein [candidate division WS1 bacterium]
MSSIPPSGPPATIPSSAGRWAAGLLLAATLLFWGPCLFGGRVPVAAVYQQQMPPFGTPLPHPTRAWDALLWDSMAQFYPWRLLLQRGFERSELPLWNPHQYCGYPFVGNGQSALFYPPNWLLAVIPADYFLGLSLALHWLLAGLLTYLLARRLGLRPAAAALAGMIYQGSGFMITWAELPTVVNTMAWLPGAWLGVELLFRRRPGGLPLLAVCLGMAVLAGHLQFTAYVWLSTGVYALARAIGRWVKGRPAPAGALLLAVMLGMGLGAPQALPTLELGAVSPRGEQGVSPEGWDFQKTRALLPVELVSLVWPEYLGDPVKGEYVGFNFTEHCGFAGVSALALALLGLAWRRDRWALFYGLGTVAALSIALAGPLAYLMYFWVPKLGQAGNFARILGVYTLCLAVLAGMGLDRLLGWVERNLVAGPPARVAIPMALGGAVMALLLFELVPWGWRFLPLSPREQVYPHTELTRTLQKAGSDPQSRILLITPRKNWSIFEVPRALLPPNADTVYGWHSPQGYDSLSLASYRDLANQAEGEWVSPKENGNMMLLQALRSPLLDAAAVGWVASLEPLSEPGLERESHSGEGIYLYRRTQAPPRMRTAPPGGAARPIGASFNTLSLETQDAKSLIIADAYYPGWLAFSSGRPVPVNRHAVFRELAPGAGTQRVWMTFYPTSVVGGLFFALLSLMTLAAIAVGGRRRGGDDGGRN